MEITAEETEEGKYYQVGNTFYGYKNNNETLTLYQKKDRLYYEVKPTETVYKEVEAMIKKHDLKQLFKLNKKEKTNDKEEYNRIRRFAELIEDIDKEMDDYLNDELNRKKKRLNELELDNYSHDLYVTRYRDNIDHYSFDILFAIYINEKMKQLIL